MRIAAPLVLTLALLAPAPLQAQEVGDSQPAATNVRGAQYPRVPVRALRDGIQEQVDWARSSGLL